MEKKVLLLRIACRKLFTGSVLTLYLFLSLFAVVCFADGGAQRVVEARLSKAEVLARGYFYDEALRVLETIPMMPGEISHDRRIVQKIAEIRAAKQSLKKYEGPAHHVFFHSLIIYPELAFDKKGAPADGYNLWMTTVSEFKKMLPELLNRGYVLYSLSDYIEPDPDNPGCIKLKDIMLPPGKIPLVISIDDLNYYEYMKWDGFACRLVIKEEKVCTEVVTPEGDVVFTRDGDVVPILDDFVEEYPEFSWRGAKGVIALTGYQGAMGYRIMPEFPPERIAAVTEKARRVADMLKLNGWLFACHSYGHSQFFRNGLLTLGKLKADTEKWKKYIEPVTGETNIYISPFGVNVLFNEKQYSDYLLESSFDIFCPVGQGRTINLKEKFMIMPRINLDGIKMFTGKKLLNENYFDVESVIDPSRPPYKKQK